MFVLQYCEDNDIDTATIGLLINKSLKEKIKIEAENLNLVEKVKHSSFTYMSYEVYNLYLAIKLHFTSDTYDYFKHNAKVNSSMNTFLKRNDQTFFHKLNTKYTKDEIIDYFISNFFASSKHD